MKLQTKTKIKERPRLEGALHSAAFRFLRRSSCHFHFTNDTGALFCHHHHHHFSVLHKNKKQRFYWLCGRDAAWPYKSCPSIENDASTVWVDDIHRLHRPPDWPNSLVSQLNEPLLHCLKLVFMFCFCVISSHRELTVQETQWLPVEYGISFCVCDVER